MQLYAYRATLTVQPTDGMQAALEDNRAQVRRKIQQFGGDPLPNEQVLLSASDNVITLLWRSWVAPDRTDLIQAVRDYAQSLTLVESWKLEYHVCGNGKRKPCQPWKTLIEA